MKLIQMVKHMKAELKSLYDTLAPSSGRVNNGTWISDQDGACPLVHVVLELTQVQHPEQLVEKLLKTLPLGAIVKLGIYSELTSRHKFMYCPLATNPQYVQTYLEQIHHLNATYPTRQLSQYLWVSVPLQNSQVPLSQQASELFDTVTTAVAGSGEAKSVSHVSAIIKSYTGPLQPLVKCPKAHYVPTISVQLASCPEKLENNVSIHATILLRLKADFVTWTVGELTPQGAKLAWSLTMYDRDHNGRWQSRLMTTAEIPALSFYSPFDTPLQIATLKSPIEHGKYISATPQDVQAGLLPLPRLTKTQDDTGLLLQTAFCELYTFSPFHRTDSYNVFVSGPDDYTGRFIAYSLLHAQCGKNAPAAIISTQPPIDTFMDIHQGRCIQINEHSTGLNPLAIMQTPQHETIAVSWLQALIDSTSPTECGTATTEQQFLHHTLLSAVALAHQQQERLSLEHVATVLKSQPTPQASYTLQCLQPYLPGGKYQHLFNGEPTQLHAHGLQHLQITCSNTSLSAILAKTLATLLHLQWANLSLSTPKLAYVTHDLLFHETNNTFWQTLLHSAPLLHAGWITSITHPSDSNIHQDTQNLETHPLRETFEWLIKTYEPLREPINHLHTYSHKTGYQLYQLSYSSAIATLIPDYGQDYHYKGFLQEHNPSLAFYYAVLERQARQP